MADPVIQVATDKVGKLSQDPAKIDDNVKAVVGVTAHEPLGVSRGTHPDPHAAGVASSATHPIMGVAGARLETDATFVAPADTVGTESRLHPVSPNADDYTHEGPH